MAAPIPELSKRGERHEQHKRTIIRTDGCRGRLVAAKEAFDKIGHVDEYTIECAGASLFLVWRARRWGFSIRAWQPDVFELRLKVGGLWLVRIEL